MTLVQPPSAWCAPSRCDTRETCWRGGRTANGLGGLCDRNVRPRLSARAWRPPLPTQPSRRGPDRDHASAGSGGGPQDSSAFPAPGAAPAVSLENAAMGLSPAARESSCSSQFFIQVLSCPDPLEQLVCLNWPYFLVVDREDPQQLFQDPGVAMPQEGIDQRDDLCVALVLYPERQQGRAVFVGDGVRAGWAMSAGASTRGKSAGGGLRGALARCSPRIRERQSDPLDVHPPPPHVPRLRGFLAGRPYEHGCRTCRYWDGDRSWPTDETRTGRCSLPLPPYLLRALEAEPVTKATEDCRFP